MSDTDVSNNGSKHELSGDQGRDKEDEGLSRKSSATSNAVTNGESNQDREDDGSPEERETQSDDDKAAQTPETEDDKARHEYKHPSKNFVKLVYGDQEQILLNPNCRQGILTDKIRGKYIPMAILEALYPGKKLLRTGRKSRWTHGARDDKEGISKSRMQSLLNIAENRDAVEDDIDLINFEGQVIGLSKLDPQENASHLFTPGMTYIPCVVSREDGCIIHIGPVLTYWDQIFPEMVNEIKQIIKVEKDAMENKRLRRELKRLELEKQAREKLRREERVKDKPKSVRSSSDAKEKGGNLKKLYY